MNFYLENTSLFLDVEKVFKETKTKYKFNYKAILHTDEKDVDIIKLISLDYKRDFVNKVGDEILIKFLFQYGDYIQHVYKKRHNLEVTIKRITLLSDGYADDLFSKQEIERYKAVFIEDMNVNANLGTANTLDLFTLNNQAPAEVVLQLVDRTLEPLRVKTVSGIFSDVNRTDLIRSILGGETSKIKVDGKQGIDSMEIIKPDNETKIKQLIIPNNTPVINIPTFLQERHTGLYTGGVGNYFAKYRKKKTWFVYPLFDITRFDNCKNKAIFYSVSSKRFGAVPRTHKLEDDILYIVITGEHTYKDDGESSQMSSGVGFRQADADMMMKKPVKITEKGPVGIRKRLNTEVAFKERDDNLNYAPVSERAIAVNHMAEYSKHLINNGARIDIIWNNSDHTLIYPGMPCKYVYITETEQQEVKGIILNCHTLVSTGSSTGIRITDENYNTITYITLFTEKFTERGKYKKQGGEGYTAVFNKQVFDTGFGTILENILNRGPDGSLGNTKEIVNKANLEKLIYYYGKSLDDDGIEFTHPSDGSRTRISLKDILIGNVPKIISDSIKAGTADVRIYKNHNAEPYKNMELSFDELQNLGNMDLEKLFSSDGLIKTHLSQVDPSLIYKYNIDPKLNNEYPTDWPNIKPPWPPGVIGVLVETITENQRHVDGKSAYNIETLRSYRAVYNINDINPNDNFINWIKPSNLRSIMEASQQNCVSMSEYMNHTLSHSLTDKAPVTYCPEPNDPMNPNNVFEMTSNGYAPVNIQGDPSLYNQPAENVTDFDSLYVTSRDLYKTYEYTAKDAIPYSDIYNPIVELANQQGLNLNSGVTYVFDGSRVVEKPAGIVSSLSTSSNTDDSSIFTPVK